MERIHTSEVEVYARDERVRLCLEIWTCHEEKEKRKIVVSRVIVMGLREVVVNGLDGEQSCGTRSDLVRSYDTRLVS